MADPAHTRRMPKSGVCRLGPVWLALLAVLSCVPAAQAAGVNRLILDTDISSDVDDVGAVAVLHALADQGKAHILAMMVSSGDPWSGPCLDALNTSFGRPDIPIGVIKHAPIMQVSRYTGYIATHYPHDLSVYGDMPEAFRLYRKILAGEPDGSVTVVSIGYLSNLSLLLRSGPDDISPLDGKTLVSKKVKHLVCMGGQYPSGREWNFYQDARAAAHVVAEWPTPVLFSGFEIGQRILTGKALRAASEKQPLRVAYLRYNNLGNRQSWDQAAVLLAFHGFDGHDNYWDLSEKGTVQVDGTGANRWAREDDGPHRYMKWNEATSRLAGIIDELMLHAATAPRN